MAAESSKGSPGASGPRAAPQQPAAMRALVAEDDPDARKVLIAHLARRGFICEGAQDGIEALGWAVAAPFDVIVTDVEMPRFDGLALITRLREQGMLERTALVVVSGHERYGSRILELAPDAYFRKPYDAEALVRTAAQLVQARRSAAARAEAARPRPGEAPATPPSAQVLEGVFGAIRPAEVCALLHRACRSGTIEFTPAGGRERGIVEVEGGAVVSARVVQGEAVVGEGKAALERALAWPEGTFVVQTADTDSSIGSGPRVPVRPRDGRDPGADTSQVTRAFGPLEHDSREDTAQLADARGPSAAPSLTSRVLDAAAGRAGAGARLGPFEVLETLEEGPNRSIHRARRVETADGSFLTSPPDPTRLIVERAPLRPPGEIAALGKVAAAGVARLLSTGSLPGGRSYYETEDPAGTTLERRVREGGALEVEAALRLAAEMLAALAGLHARGLAHGSLDARKVVLQAGGRAALLDAGLRARHVPDGLHTLRAQAPEVWRGAAPGPRADLYACGVLLFLALTGRYPFDASSALAIGALACEAPVPSLAEGGLERPGAALEALVSNLLAKDPAVRLPDAGAARGAVEALLAKPSPGTSSGTHARPLEATPPPAGYRYTRWIGRGGYAEVYEAWHETLERRVAIKMIRPERAASATARARFLREARLAASLVHPHVVQVFDAREEHGNLFLVMEYIDGVSVKARLQREGAFAPPAALAIARQALEGISAAHARSIIHRDIKPDNILLGPGGVVKVADFGLARSLSVSNDITKAGEVLGTAHYISPEQASGRALDERTDLYGLGATLFHMLTGRPPFEGTTSYDILEQHVYGDVPRVRAVAPSVPPALAAVVERLLAKQPEDRYPDAAAVMAALGSSAGLR